MENDKFISVKGDETSHLHLINVSEILCVSASTREREEGNSYNIEIELKARGLTLLAKFKDKQDRDDELNRIWNALPK